jgi:hypothetical protein
VQPIIEPLYAYLNNENTASTDYEQENSNGDYLKMKAVFEKRIQLYLKYLAEDDLTELERLMLSNKREWQMSHLLGLIEHEDVTNKLSDLTKRIYRLEKKTAELYEYY